MTPSPSCKYSILFSDNNVCPLKDPSSCIVLAVGTLDLLRIMMKGCIRVQAQQ